MAKRLDPQDPRGFLPISEPDGKMKNYFTIVDRNTGLPKAIPFIKSRNGVLLNEKGNVLFHNPNDRGPSFPGINLK